MATGQKAAAPADRPTDALAEQRQAEADARESQAAQDKLNAEQAAERQKAEADAAEDAAKEARKVEGTHIVVMSAFVMRVGEKADQVARYRRGAIITPDPKLVDIDRMVAAGAISPNDGKPKAFTTARIAAKLAGALDDPAHAPVHDVIPLQPTDTVAAHAN